MLFAFAAVALRVVVVAAVAAAIAVSATDLAAAAVADAFALTVVVVTAVSGANFHGFKLLLTDIQFHAFTKILLLLLLIWSRYEIVFDANK